jgi:hypothetical protein
MCSTSSFMAYRRCGPGSPRLSRRSASWFSRLGCSRGARFEVGGDGSANGFRVYTVCHWSRCMPLSRYCQLGAVAGVASLSRAAAAMRPYPRGGPYIQFTIWSLVVCINVSGLPHQATTGSKPRLLRISKRGNRYLRKNLIHGAQSVLPYLVPSDTPLGRSRGSMHPAFLRYYVCQAERHRDADGERSHAPRPRPQRQEAVERRVDQQDRPRDQDREDEGRSHASRLQARACGRSRHRRHRRGDAAPCQSRHRTTIAGDNASEMSVSYADIKYLNLAIAELGALPHVTINMYNGNARSCSVPPPACPADQRGTSATRC